MEIIKDSQFDHIMVDYINLLRAKNALKEQKEILKSFGIKLREQEQNKQFLEKFLLKTYKA